MAGVWRSPIPKAPAEQEQAATEQDRALRKQCLLWAFQARKLSGDRNLDIESVAQSFYDFITGRRQEWLDAMQAKT